MRGRFSTQLSLTNIQKGHLISYKMFGLNIFYLYTLYIEQHIKTYNNIQYTNGIQKKVFRLIRICIPFKI